MANKLGPMLSEKQFWSKKWVGHIDCGGGVFRLPGRTKNGNPKNYYFREGLCSFCGKESLLTKNSKRKKSSDSFCSPQCQYENIKIKHAGNKHIKSRPGGDHHTMVLRHGHHRANRGGQVYEHILVAESLLGRPITKTEVVHHINCVKSDNSPENLFVCSGSKEHFLIHGSLNKCVSELMILGLLEFDPATKTYKVKK